MTNKSGVRKGTQVRTLDLEFDGTTAIQKGVTLNNGFRPHGGYRGINKYPISQYSFNREYRQQLRDDIDRLFGADSLESLTSPGYAIHTSREMTHSGDSPLFENKLLAPSRLEQKFSPEEYSDILVKAQKRPKRPSSGVQYYRPDSSHHYLSASRSDKSNDTECKLGRPTRTTLLRARHRCNSAPVNVYKMRKEIQKQYEQKQEGLRSSNPTMTVKDLLGLSVPSGESVHSFLIGARYNSAHCLDSRSMMTHGVYMPRGNPLGCFVLKEKTKEESEGVPATPPGYTVFHFSDINGPNPIPKLVVNRVLDAHVHLNSPVSDSDNEDDGRPGTPVSKQAWNEETSQEKRRTVKCTNIPIMQQIMNIHDGLNVKGTGVVDKNKKKLTRPASARVGGSRPSSARVAASSRINSCRGPKPFVLIQGKSFPRSARSAGDQSLLHTQPSSPPPSPVGKELYNARNARPRSSRQRRQREPMNVSVPSLEEVNILEPTTKKVISVEENQKKQQVESDFDNKGSSVENGAPSEIKVHIEEENSIYSEHRDMMHQQERDDCDITSNGDKLLSEDNNNLIAATKRTSKVRFADEVEELQTPKEEEAKQDDSKPESHQGQGDNAVFFITEEGKDIKEVNGQSSEQNIQNTDAVELIDVGDNAGNGIEQNESSGNAITQDQNDDQNSLQSTDNSETMKD